MSENKRSLYDIDAELQEVQSALDLLNESGTEEEFLAATASYLGDLSTELHDKIDRYIAYAESRQRRADQILLEFGHYKAEADRLKILAESAASESTKAKNRLRDYMTLKGVSKIETPLHAISVVANGGKRSVDILPGVEPLNVQPEYTKTETVLNTDAIRKALESGEELGWAKLKERGTRLNVR